MGGGPDVCEYVGVPEREQNGPSLVGDRAKSCLLFPSELGIHPSQRETRITVKLVSPKMGPELLSKAWGFLFITRNLILVTVGKAEQQGRGVHSSLVELDLGSNPSPLAS